MRVLCVDPRGVLGSLPSPVLYPEYGDGFLHAPGLDGDHAISVTEFLHGGRPDEKREVWLLWQSGLERYEIESLATSLHERMAEHMAVAVHGIQITWVKQGAESGQFFDPDRKNQELSWFADKGSQCTADGRWRTLLLGLQPGERSTDDELLITLALRAWLDREQLDCPWREPHYRALIHYAKSGASNSRSGTLNLLREDWQKVFGQLDLRRKSLQTAHCNRKMYGEPTVSWAAFPEAPKGDRSPYCSFSRRFSGGSLKKCIGWFFDPDDREVVKRWIEHLYGKLKDAVHSVWQAADDEYHDELRRLHDGPSKGAEGEKLNPWQAVQKYEKALRENASLPDDQTSPEALVAEIADKQRLHTVQLFEAIRCRPSRTMFLTTVSLATLGLLAAVFFRDLPSVSAAIHQLPSEAWPLGLVMMVLLAAAWGIWQAQAPFRNGVTEAVAMFDSSWDAARERHSSYCSALAMAIRRVVALRNLEIAREERAERELELGQIAYHMNRLAEYFRAYGGGDMIANLADVSMADFNPSLPEARNPAYWWNRAGTQVPIEGLPNQHTDQCVFANSRLAGIERIEIHAVAPVGRRTASPA